jgi:hypothetical protein
MNILHTICLSALLVVVVSADDTPLTLPDVDDSEITSMYARDIENEPPALGFGAKYMTGGGGEGMQLLEPNGDFKFRQQVKSDNALPAYCNPPNPCPKGYTEEDGCQEQFDNTAEFSKAYQEAQNCLCDQEHMRSCPVSHEQIVENMPDDVNELSDAINTYLTQKNEERHAALVAKKGDDDDDDNAAEDEEPTLVRRKRSIHAHHDKQHKPLWQQGHVLKDRVKKG